MASYSHSGCELNIITNGLARVIQDPEAYIKVPNWDREDESDLSDYPDALIIPNNGVCISPFAKYEEQRFVRREDGSIVEYEKQTYPQWDVGVTSIFNCSGDIAKPDVEILDEELLKNPFCIVWAGLNSLEYLVKHEQEMDPESNWKEWKKVTITLQGESGYFRSNADHYSAIGTTIYIQSYYMAPEIVGAMKITTGPSENGETLNPVNELYQVNMSNLNERRFKDKTLKYNPCSTRLVSPGSHMSTGGDYVLTDNCKCDAMYKTFSSANDKYRNAFIQVKNDFIVCVHPRTADTSQYSTNFFYWIKGDEQSSLKADIRRGYGCRSILCKSTSASFPVKDATKPQYFWGKSFKNAMLSGIITFPNSDGMVFSDFYAIDQGNLEAAPNAYSAIAKYVVGIGGDIPTTPWGLNVYPIFTIPICTYLNFNTDRQSDPKHVFGNVPEIDNDVRIEMDKLYGAENILRKNVSNWATTTVADELE